MSLPGLYVSAFHCSHCHVYAKQDWFIPRADELDLHWIAENLGETLEEAKAASAPRLDKGGMLTGSRRISGLMIACCSHCEMLSLWVGVNCIYPFTRHAARPNPDMPTEVLQDYEEAAEILASSPRGAAALLRLALQKLCKELGEPGKDINKDIGSLVRKGLDQRIQKALDSVRVIGNESVHPGSLDMKDNADTAKMLFQLLNMVVDRMITQEKEVDAVYELLPEAKRQGIEDRDKARGP